MPILGLIIAIMICSKVRHRWKEDASAVDRHGWYFEGCRNHAPWDWHRHTPWERHRSGDDSASSSAHGQADSARGQADSTRGEAASRRRGAGNAGEAARPERRRRRSIAGFFAHLYVYCSVIGLLAFINIFTGFYPWFL